jgi:hypothetical protein
MGDLSPCRSVERRLYEKRHPLGWQWRNRAKNVQTGQKERTHVIGFGIANCDSAADRSADVGI